MLCVSGCILDRLPSGNSFHRVEVFAALAAEIENRPAQIGRTLAVPDVLEGTVGTVGRTEAVSRYCGSGGVSAVPVESKPNNRTIKTNMIGIMLMASSSTKNR
jgi:hypothetical protein